MCSKKTADLLIGAGKGNWITPRSELVQAKGKGMMQCYWIHSKTSQTGSASEDGERIGASIELGKHMGYDSNNCHKSVRWMTEIFIGLLRDVLIHREATNQSLDQRLSDLYRPTILNDDYIPETFTSPRDEVSEMIVLPTLDGDYQATTESSDVQISDLIRQQIEQYIKAVAALYRRNPFHNFDHGTFYLYGYCVGIRGKEIALTRVFLLFCHSLPFVVLPIIFLKACHVVMATQKLLARVIESNNDSISATAYGITSDPLTQFAIVFSALIHDVDHPGVSNAQLVIEQTDMAIKYGHKSVAEQNSVTIAWELLMEPWFFEFRNAIMPGQSESRRFRQLLVNSVMATDLFDGELKKLRENRWNKAFDSITSILPSDRPCEDNTNRRATIVIEHIIQASDVAHTMQHWHVYQKWNSRLLHEMYAGYAVGRAEKNPIDGWYEGELWFFDNYIIPLAKKLQTCGVFGVSCDELLDYANDNRAEWAVKGRDIVANFAATIEKSTKA